MPLKSLRDTTSRDLRTRESDKKFVIFSLKDLQKRLTSCALRLRALPSCLFRLSLSFWSRSPSANCLISCSNLAFAAHAALSSSSISVCRVVIRSISTCNASISLVSCCILPSLSPLYASLNFPYTEVFRVGER